MLLPHTCTWYGYFDIGFFQRSSFIFLVYVANVIAGPDNQHIPRRNVMFSQQMKQSDSFSHQRMTTSRTNSPQIPNLGICLVKTVSQLPLKKISRGILIIVSLKTIGSRTALVTLSSNLVAGYFRLATSGQRCLSLSADSSCLLVRQLQKCIIWDMALHR